MQKPRIKTKDKNFDGFIAGCPIVRVETEINQHLKALSYNAASFDHVSNNLKSIGYSSWLRIVDR